MASARKPAVLRVLVGRTSSTGVVHRLTFTDDGLVRIERQSYQSSHPDGWTQAYTDLVEPATNHAWLIDDLEKNRCEW